MRKLLVLILVYLWTPLASAMKDPCIGLVRPGGEGALAGAVIPQIQIDQVIRPGRSAGRVWVLREAELVARLERQEVTPLDWIVVDRLPVDADAFPVAGIVVSEPTPLGTHWDVLSERMGFPLLLQKGCHENANWKRMAKDEGFYEMSASADGQLTIHAQGTVEGALRIIRERLQAAHQLQPIDWSQSELSFSSALENPRTQEARDFGDKIADLSFSLHKTNPYHFPKGAMGFTFRYMGDALHNEAPRIQGTLKALEADSVRPPAIAQGLEEIRNRIETTKISEDLWAEIFRDLENQGLTGAAIRIRTSTRGEDRMGAGLYDSVRVAAAPIAEWKEAVKRAFRKAWASYFSLRGYWVRRLYGAPQRVDGMALLVHHSYDDGAFHGVARYSGLYSLGSGEIVAYPNGDSATNPRANAQPQHYSFSGAGVGDNGNELLTWRWRDRDWTPEQFLAADPSHKVIADTLRALSTLHVRRFGVRSPTRNELRIEWTLGKDPTNQYDPMVRTIFLQTSPKAAHSPPPQGASTNRAHLPAETYRFLEESLARDWAELPPGLRQDLENNNYLPLLGYLLRALPSQSVPLIHPAFILGEIAGKATLITFQDTHSDAFTLIATLCGIHKVSWKPLEFGDLTFGVHPDPQTSDPRVIFSSFQWSRRSTNAKIEQAYLKCPSPRPNESAGEAIRKLIEVLDAQSWFRFWPTLQVEPSHGFLTWPGLEHWLPEPTPLEELRRRVSAQKPGRR